MNSTASLSLNRISVGLQPGVYAALWDEAKTQRVRLPEIVRQVLLRWVEDRERRRVGHE